MLQLNSNQTRNAIEACLVTDTPLIIWGAPGIGKSQIQKQIADDLGALLIDIRLSQYDSVDMRGIPSVKEGFTTWNPPTTMPFVGSEHDTKANKDRLIVLFLDELLQAMTAVQATAFQLCLDRAVGEHRLMPNVRVVAATNRETDRAGTNRMLTPLANRFTHVEMVPSLDSWTDWAWGNDIAPEIIAFMRFRPDLLSTFDPTKGDKVFASPRTWEYANRFVKQGLPVAVRDALLHGSVGSGPATELAAFMEVWQDMPDPDECIKNPEKAPIPPKTKPATMFAISAALVQRANKDNLANIVKYVERLPLDYTIRTIKDAVRKNLELAGSEVFIRAMSKYQDLIKG